MLSDAPSDYFVSSGHLPLEVAISKLIHDWQYSGKLICLTAAGEIFLQVAKHVISLSY